MSLTDRVDDLTTRVAEEFNAIRSENAQTTPIHIHGSGRFYTEKDRWVTNSDDQYGPQYHQFAEQSGGNVPNPVMEWEHLGHLIPVGRKVHRLYFSGRGNNANIGDLEIQAVLRSPSLPSWWQSGFDDDRDMNNTILFRDQFMSPTTVGQNQLTGDIRDMHMQVFELPSPVLVDQAPAFLSIYLRGTNSNNRYYFYSSYLWELS